MNAELDNTLDLDPEDPLFDEISRINNELINARRQVEKRNIDISRLNQELVQSNQDLQQFAYVISHDLKEPLRMITAFLSLLSKNYADTLDQNAKEYIDFAVDGAERMKAMIDGILALSRVETRSKPYTLVSGNEVLQKARQNLYASITESQATINIGTLPSFYGDEDLIIQVFQNLIANAIKFSGKNPPQIDISYAQVEGNIIFSVRDYGIGIESQNHEKIFGLFSRLHTNEEYSGLGIGLALCRRIIEQHRGKIWVESEPGHGSVFHFSLRTLGEQNDASL